MPVIMNIINLVMPQLSTVRFLGTFLSNPFVVPSDAINYTTKQLGINLLPDINHYMVKHKPLR